MTAKQEHRPPVILLDGGVNALSVARSLGKRGILVHALVDASQPARHSRYCRWIPPSVAGEGREQWLRFLLGPRAEYLRGSVLLACSDDGIQWIARHREALASRYLLDESNPESQLAMLNKLETYRVAVAAGVPTPKFWTAGDAEEIRSLSASLRFPLIIKPLYSQAFERQFGVKLFIVGCLKELLERYESLKESTAEVMLVEMIPGPDDRLCSYYTYLDENSDPLFDFTKRIIRRYPRVMGAGCSHVTDWNPEVRDLALRLFRQAGLRGLANAEFKRDERDGQLKLIECNARFTAANCLLARSGLDLANFVYDRIVGNEHPPFGLYQEGRRLWYPAEDLCSFFDLRRRGELTSLEWLRSIFHRQTLPVFDWRDPVPTIAREWARLRRIASRASPFGRRRHGGVSADGLSGTEPPFRRQLDGRMPEPGICPSRDTEQIAAVTGRPEEG
ncbi:MAG: carboxylate--amine ligase [Planctomycetota bacterium]